MGSCTGSHLKVPSLLQAPQAHRWICLWGTSPPTPCTTFSLEPRMTSAWWLSTQEERAERWLDREQHVRAHVLLRERPPAGGTALTVLSSAVYLNVTNIETFNVDHDKFCIKWTPHRSATSYRIKLNPVDCKSPSCSDSSSCLLRGSLNAQRCSNSRWGRADFPHQKPGQKHLISIRRVSGNLKVQPEPLFWSRSDPGMCVFPEQFEQSDFHLHSLTVAAGVSRAAGSRPLTELHAGFPAEIPPAAVASGFVCVPWRTGTLSVNRVSSPGRFLYLLLKNHKIL